MCFSNGHYPDTWADGYISPIFKSEDPADPNDYRRITITSSLGKVFNNVLNTRLDSFLTEHNLIPPSQVGFTKHAMVYFTFRNMFFSVKRLRIFVFPQNLTLGYMAKTLNKIIFFSSTKIRIFFQQHWESEYLKKKKKKAYPPPSPSS